MTELQKAEAIAELCRVGSSTPNGVKDMPDIFWLMGYGDWAIEAQLIREEVAHVD